MQKELLSKLNRELEIRNFSKSTIKSYMHHVKRFLEYSGNDELNENSVKNYIQLII